MCQGTGFFNIGIKFKKQLGSLLLFYRPFIGRLKEQVTKSFHRANQGSDNKQEARRSIFSVPPLFHADSADERSLKSALKSIQSA
jgi:hypothetical protein